MVEFSDKYLDGFQTIVHERRSIRKFTEEKIPDAVIDACLDLALLSPNSSNLQPWEFWVINDPELREQLKPACLNQNAARTASHLIAVVGRRNTWRDHAAAIVRDYPGGNPPAIIADYYNKQAPLLYGQGPLGLLAPLKKLMFALQGIKRPVMRDPNGRAAQKEWVTKTCALAAQTLMLALRAHGYDSCPMEGFDSRRVRKILQLPSDAWVVMFIAAGRRAPKGVYGERYRVPRDEVIRYK